LQNINVAIPEDVYEDFKKFTKNKEVDKITDYSDPSSRRDVVETIIFFKILKELQSDYKVTVKSYISYRRMIKNVEDGTFDVTSTSIWESDVSQLDILKSAKIINGKDFNVGIYGLSSTVSKIKSKKDIFNQSIISNIQWTRDWNTISKLPFKNVVKSNSWESILKMLNKGRADITLAPISGRADMRVSLSGIHLFPIKGFKLNLNESRYFIFSKKNQHSQKFYKDFNKKLLEHIESGEVKKAYIQSGFMNKEIETWESLN
jgi:hypothetical protein